MAQLPYSEGVPSVLPRESVPDDYQHINMPAGAGGGLIARGLQTAGEGVTRAAEAGIDWAQFAENVNVDDQFNHTVNAFDTISYGDPNKKVMGPDGQPIPDTGYFGLQGRSASDQREATIKAMEDARQEGRKNLKTAKSQLDYDRQTRRLFDDRIRQIGAHADQQWKVWAQGVNKTGAEQSMANYLRAVQSGDEDQQNRWGMDYVKLYVQQHQLRLGTLDDATSRSLGDEAQRDLLKQRVMFIGADDASKAGEILEANKDLAGSDYHALADHLRGRKEDQRGNAAGNQAVAMAAAGAAPQGAVKPVAGIPGSFVRATRNIEGFDATPKWDVKQWTIGFGTRASGPNERASMPELEARFDDEYAKAAAIVEKVNPNLDPGTKAALTSLTFNTGNAWTAAGLGQAVRDGDLATAKQLFQQYNQVGGKFSPAIATRRMTEAGWFGKNEPDGGITPLQSAGAIKAGGYRAIIESPGLNDRERDIAFRRVDRAYNEALIADELKIKGDADARDRSLIQYQRLLKAAYESENPTEAIRQVLDYAYQDAGLTKAADRPELERIARQFFQYDPPEKYGTGYADLLAGVFKGEGEEGYTGPVQIAKAFGDGVLTKNGFDRLNTTYERAHKNHEYAQSHFAFSNILQKYKEEMAKEQIIPGAPSITNLRGMERFHDFANRVSAEFDAHMTKAGANPYDFINDRDHLDKVRDEIYPPAQRKMDEVGSLQATKGAGQPVPAAPEGVAQKAWDDVMAARPIIDGQPWGADWWGKAVNQLRSNPSPETFAAFKRNFPDFDPQAIVAKLGTAPPAGQKATKTEQKAVFTPAIGGAAPAAAEPAARRTGLERPSTAKPFAETAEEAIRGAIASPEAQRPPPLPHRPAPLVPIPPVRPAPAPAPAAPAGPGAATQAARAMHDALTRALTPETPRRPKHPPSEAGER